MRFVHVWTKQCISSSLFVAKNIKMLFFFWFQVSYIKEKSRPLIYFLEVYKLQNVMKHGKFSHRIGSKVHWWCPGTWSLVLFYDGLRRQCTNSKIRVCANIGIMTSFPKASLCRANDVLIFPIFGRNYVIFFPESQTLWCISLSPCSKYEPIEWVDSW